MNKDGTQSYEIMKVCIGVHRSEVRACFILILYVVYFYLLRILLLFLWFSFSPFAKSRIFVLNLNESYIKIVQSGKTAQTKRSHFSLFSTSKDTLESIA